MKRTLVLIFALSAAAVAGHSVSFSLSAANEKDQLLQVRETVWRSWFAGDLATLERLVPPETIAISASEQNWETQKEIIQGAADFHKAGGKLIRLEFPRTEIQNFGDVAMTYSQYVLETEVGGKRSTSSGRATEIFVRRAGQWVNPGWHTDSVK
ncbi:MAG: nuclear transport factor 2 family protein [Candidatus Acidiferrales bacterium]